MAGNESRLRNVEQQLQQVLLELANTNKEVATTKVELARIKQEFTITKAPRTTIVAPQPRATIKTAIYQIYNRLVYGRDVEDWPRYLAAMATASTSGNQTIPVVVKVSHVTDKKRHREKWESAHFSVNYNGKLRKMYLCFDASSSIRDSTALLHLYVIMNRHDPTLYQGEKSSSTRLKVQVLNQITNENHKKLPVVASYSAYDNLTTGKVMIYSFTVDTAMDDQWCKNDCIFFEVSIDTISPLWAVILLVAVLLFICLAQLYTLFL